MYRDAMLEILTRTSSLKTLDTCKCVSNEWNDLISESNFMPKYCKNTNNLNGYFVQAFKKTKHISTFVDMSEEKRVGMKLPEYIRILASCNQGLLCCIREEYRKYRFYVCKPSTSQWRALPNPKLRYQTISVAIMVVGSSPKLHYKIVRLSKDQEPRVYRDFTSVRCEVFDSNAWKWRETRKLHLQRSDFIAQFDPAVKVGESFYWLTFDDNVVEFDSIDESFERFPLPKVDEKKRLVSYRGRLGFMTYKRDSGIELWLSDESEMKWTLKTNGMILSGRAELLHPVGFYSSEIACVRSYDKAVFYNFQDRSVIKEVDLREKVPFANEYFEFRSDFEPVDLSGGFRKPKLSRLPANRRRHSVLFLILGILLLLRVSKVWLNRLNQTEPN